MITTGIAKKSRLGSTLRRTPQRDAILRYLERNTGHPSASEIFDAVRNELPGMSFATVYNTLERLRESGEVRELGFDPKRRRFDPDPQHHHHVVCVQCGTIRDVHGEFPVQRENSDLEDFEVLEAQIEFYGICPKCRKGGEDNGGF